MASNEVGHNIQQNAFPNIPTNESECQSCVICLGSTGTGKTSTIQKCTLQDSFNSGCESNGPNETCKIYKCQQEKVDDVDDLHSDFLGRFLWKSIQELVWVDTFGWNDRNRDGDSKWIFSDFMITSI